MNIIRTEQDGIEFFTVAATGESGMSQTGLAILAGVSQQAMNQLCQTLTSRAPSKSLEPWLDKELTLTTTDSATIDGKPSGNLTIYYADFCVDRIFHPDGKFFSIRGWAKLNNIKVSKQEAANLGRQATKTSKSLGVYIDKLEDPRYGEVNIYHETILRQVFEVEEE